MIKTAKQIQSDIYQLLRGSQLAASVTGNVYIGGMRPRDSVNEDIVVLYVSGIPAQIQTGVVLVQIYVPDIAPFANGVYVENAARLAELEAAAMRWVEELQEGRTAYYFELQNTIQTDFNDDIKQHFVAIHLKYKLFE